MFGTSANYVRSVRQRTGADGFPRCTAADLDWQFNRRRFPDHAEYYRQKAKEHYWRRRPAKLTKLKQAPRQITQRILSEVEIATLIRAAKTDRDRLMFDLAYFGGLRASELVSLTWAQVIRRDSGEAQLSIVGKGSRGREVATARQSAHRVRHQLHCQGSRGARRREPRRHDPLAARRAHLARDRQRRSHYACLGYLESR